MEKGLLIGILPFVIYSCKHSTAPPAVATSVPVLESCINDSAYVGDTITILGKNFNRFKNSIGPVFQWGTGNKYSRLKILSADTIITVVPEGAVSSPVKVEDILDLYWTKQKIRVVRDTVTADGKDSTVEVK